MSTLGETFVQSGRTCCSPRSQLTETQEEKDIKEHPKMPVRFNRELDCPLSSVSGMDH